MNKTVLIALFGESGSGKDTGVNYLTHNYPYHKIILTTSRPIRENETPDIDYHYNTTEEIIYKNNQSKFLNLECFNGWFYGIENSEILKNQINIGAFSIQSIIDIMEEIDLGYIDITIVPIYIKTNGKDRLLRVLCREENPNCREICRRFYTDADDFSKIYFDYDVVENLSSYDEFYKNLTKTVKSCLKNYEINMEE